ISYLHIELLCSIPTREQRQELLARTVKESWHTRELAYEIHQIPELKPKGEDGRGRPLAVPRDLDALLRQQVRCAEDFLNRAVKVWQQAENSVLARLQEMDEEEFTEERAAQLKGHAEKLRELATEATKRAEDVQRAHEYVRGIIDLQKRPMLVAPPAPALR